MDVTIVGVVLLVVCLAAWEAPRVIARDAPELRFRDTDCNSPAHWDGDTLYVFNSIGQPYRSHGPDVAHLDTTGLAVEYDTECSGARWIESTWRDEDGTLWGWYHNEPLGVATEVTDRHLTAPRIGAIVSNDNGAKWHDLGFVLDAPTGTLHHDTANYYFAGGNGDFCVIPDREREWVYFLISTYGDFAEQGVAVARMAYSDLASPVARVSKWHAGAWSEPGLGGHLTPIFPAKVDWHRADADAFWGPSVHWNTHLRLWVMLLNRTFDKDWTQEGIYVTFCRDLADPAGWAEPTRIMDAPFRPGWYPQVMGLQPGGTDKEAGAVARLFVHGVSRWEIEFV
ncbi:MAG: DUF4185 domain-containing protein [Armatimonadetes bacterium]|nr:DUF4185 domain-containing protein [Armatimonadota bacterium]